MNFLFVTLALTSFVSVESAGWSYDDPTTWGNNYPACNGKSQSPINIIEGQAKHDDRLDKFILDKYDTPMAFEMLNNGHTIKLTPKGVEMSADKGGLPAKFVVAQFHFHWSEPKPNMGSEHTVDGESYPLELHIVHVNSDYGDITEALKHKDGLAVFGFMFKKGNENKGIAKFLKNIPEEKKTVTTPAFSLFDMIDKYQMVDYFRYEGSLTTPPCAEAVIWTVFKKPLTVSEAQLKTIRDVEDHANKTMSNYRPIQMLNGRQIWKSFHSSGTMTTAFSVLVFFSVFMVTNLW